jgi:hypothetical protein
VQVVEEGLRLVLSDGLGLSNDGRLLGVDSLGVESGVGQHIADDLGHLGDTVGKRATGVGGELSGGVSVELSTDVFDIRLELGNRSRGGAFSGRSEGGEGERKVGRREARGEGKSEI